MKIGIVTIYDGNNMGSFLQAVALKFAIEDLGHEVVFIERMTAEENLKLFLNRSFSKPRPFPLNYIAVIKRAIFNYSQDKKRRDEIKKIYDVLSKERISLPTVSVDSIYDLDLIICGSDEIWNFNNTSISVPFYTCLNYGFNIRKIAYAVSIGSSSTEDFEKHSDVINVIKTFDRIFPRDIHSQEVLEGLLNTRLKTVCDPTLLVDRNRMDDSFKIPYDGEYIMLYAYDLSNEEKKYLKRFSKEHGIPIFSVLHYSEIADKIITESPFHFAGIIKNSSYCYTSTFHGTIFCTLFANKFVYRSRRLKVKQVAETMGVQDREWISGTYNEFKEMMECKLDRIRIDNTLNEIKKNNNDLLKGIIENANLQ